MTMDVEGIRKYEHKHPVSKNEINICPVGFAKGAEIGQKIEIEQSKEVIRSAVKESITSDRLGIDIFNIKAEDGNNPNKVKETSDDMEPGK